MYIPASDQCNVISVNIDSPLTASSSSFVIRVSQIECGSRAAPPEGCLQFFTGSAGSLNSFNYNDGNGVLLFNQDYTACVRFFICSEQHGSIVCQGPKETLAPSATIATHSRCPCTMGLLLLEISALM